MIDEALLRRKLVGEHGLIPVEGGGIVPAVVQLARQRHGDQPEDLAEVLGDLAFLSDRLPRLFGHQPPTKRAVPVELSVGSPRRQLDVVQRVAGLRFHLVEICVGETLGEVRADSGKGDEALGLLRAGHQREKCLRRDEPAVRRHELGDEESGQQPVLGVGERLDRRPPPRVVSSQAHSRSNEASSAIVTSAPPTTVARRPDRAETSRLCNESTAWPTRVVRVPGVVRKSRDSSA